jgi:hypothetical protein
MQNPVASSIPEGPSEYTRLFAAQAATPPATAPPSAQQPATEKAAPAKPAAKPQSALWIFIGVLALLALCAIAVIVYFAMKR